MVSINRDVIRSNKHVFSLKIGEETCGKESMCKNGTESVCKKNNVEEMQKQGKSSLLWGSVRRSFEFPSPCIVDFIDNVSSFIFHVL